MIEMKSPMLTFRFHEGDVLVRTETLTERIIKVGKLPSSHLRIDDEDVSRMHAVVEVSGEGDVFVIDLGSATGTFVNGKRVNKARLSSGDTLAMGSARMTIDIDVAPLDVARAIGEMVARPPAPEPTRAPPAALLADPTSSLLLANPFAMPVSAPLASHHADVAIEDGENIRWGIAASGPPVNPADLETTASAAEIVIMWGDESVLHVAHLSPPRSFYVGERAPGREVDYGLGSELLGLDRMPVVLEVAGQIAVVVPDGATGEVTVGSETRTLEALAAEGKLTPCSELASARQMLLPAAATARVCWKGFQIVTRSTSAGRPVGADLRAPSWQSHLWTALSLGVHATLVLMFYFMPPSTSSLSLDLVDDRSRLIDYLVDASEVIDEEVPTWMEPSAAVSDGAEGAAHDGPSGAMGDESSEPTDNHYAVEGPPDNPDPHLAREEALESARTAGALGALAVLSGSWASPTSPYGADTALGTDPSSALGALMGDNLGSNFGFGGLGPNGTGRGGGGPGLGTIGMGRLGTLGGTCVANCAERGHGYGIGAPLGGHGPASHGPEIHAADPVITGGLSREVIRRVVRRHINEVRFCYEQELASRPDLSGRVTVAFIIGPTGAVTAASVGATTLGNARVESCITTATRRWAFPPPDGGGVAVSYPFVLASGE